MSYAHNSKFIYPSNQISTFLLHSLMNSTFNKKVFVMEIQRSGSQSSQKGSTENFIGSVRVDFLFMPKQPERTSGAYVTFEPGARTAWHQHPLGQKLIVTAGCGLVQLWGEQIQVIRPGYVVHIAANEKHWHGASASIGMTHIAVQEQENGKSVTWLEPVYEEDYAAQPVL